MSRIKGKGGEKTEAPRFCVFPFGSFILEEVWPESGSLWLLQESLNFTKLKSFLAITFESATASECQALTTLRSSLPPYILILGDAITGTIKDSATLAESLWTLHTPSNSYLLAHPL
ncbi:hypothetical protein VNO77_34873 [Canavalia gladiata]|uniref:Uncharacterized protein n=1 Tax=Canavalia gladiata TaxID=3824 RepID=A0AAN9PZG0_CANGL